MTDQRFLAIDTETTGLDWWGPHEAFLVTTSDAENDWTYVLDREEDREALVAQVTKATDLIFFNAQFDIHMLVKTGLFTYDELLAKGIHDTSVLARLLLTVEDVNYSFRLKNIATQILGEDSADEETELKHAMHEEGIISSPTRVKLPDGAYKDLFDARPEVVIKYAEKDTRITWELYGALMARLDDPPVHFDERGRKDSIAENLKSLWNLEREVQIEATRIEARGIRLDPKAMADLTAEAEKLEAQYEANLSEYTADFPDFNADSSPQVGAMLLAAGVPLHHRTEKTGELVTAKWALDEFADHPAVAALQGYRLYSKFLSTYLHPWSGREVLHPGLHTVGADTGRMSSSRPAMQNIPTRSGFQMRTALVPRDGMSLVVADYSSIELRILAYYMDDEQAWDLILNHDFFLWMGEEIYGTPDQESWGVSRSTLKNTTYAIMYGAWDKKVAETIGNGMTTDEAGQLITDIKSSFGNAYFDLEARVKRQARQTRRVTTILGRRQWSPLSQKGWPKAYAGLNYLIQGTAADVMKLGLVNVARATHEYGAHILLPVHDELVTEVPTERAEDWAGVLSARMEGALDDVGLNHPLPLKAESVICHNNYAEAK